MDFEAIKVYRSTKTRFKVWASKQRLTFDDAVNKLLNIAENKKEKP